MMGVDAEPRRPRLLIVGPLPPPIGGVETFTEAILASPVWGAFDLAHCDTTKGRAKDTQGRFDAANAVWALRHFGRLARALSRHRPEVVYIPIAGTWSGFLRDAALGWIARRSGARVIGHQHAGDIADVLARNGFQGRLVRGGFGQFQRLLVLGSRWRTMFETYGLTMPIEICPSTFRRDVFEAGRTAKSAPPPSGALRVLFVGQVGRRKGVLDLLAALARLRDRGVATTLTVVGPAQQPGELEAAQRESAGLGLGDRVVFTGALTGAALLERYRSHDVLALPSHNEGMPAVLYEAGAFGLAVVATPVGGIGDLIRDGANGRLVPVGDPATLAETLAALAADRAEVARLGSALRHDIEAFLPDRVSERIAASVRAELAAR